MSQKTKQNLHDTRRIAKQLDNFLAREIEYIPYKKGNTVYIQGYRIVKKADHVYLVYKGSDLIANCFYKKSAFAIVKNLINSEKINSVIEHDRILEKYYNDSLFYMHTITSTKDSTKYEVAKVRLDMASYQIEHHASAISNLAKWY